MRNPEAMLADRRKTSRLTLIICPILTALSGAQCFQQHNCIVNEMVRFHLSSCFTSDDKRIRVDKFDM